MIMRKILIGISVILLAVLAGFAIGKGLEFNEQFKILSVEQIQIENEKLKSEIAETQDLMLSKYPTKTDELETNVNTMMAKKDEYLDLASISTEGEIGKANSKETYKIEFLWTRVGNHATGEGIILKMDVETGDYSDTEIKNLSFEITGTYSAIIEFLRDLETDDKLDFKIDNFKMLPGGGEGSRFASFTVRNIRIDPESIAAQVQ